MFTYAPATDRGRVRLMIPDRVAASAMFDDDEIDTFLALEGDEVRLATAMALETIASDQAMTLKVIRLLDLSTDGAKVSDALLARAAGLRAAAAADGSFDWGEMVVDDFSYRERLYNQALRGL